ncbi:MULTISPECIES: carbon-nitrogen hydrolase family protein [unclassified Bradyrhizobium]|uniref:carbon-nitrogen hydrolase family protein n=1 Tax=unclassified Bradyrhizobium TaxID=2631580 RepID=UPI002916EBFA|nr:MULTISPECIES: carbon-nitrogen hydrolase family protein [unclassified Bradyrhizobium]
MNSTTSTVDRDQLTIGLAQIAPVWLERTATLQKVVDCCVTAAKRGCGFLAFGEALAPGYPFWIEHTDGARFESGLQKEIHAHYLDQAVQIEAGHLEPVTNIAKELGLAVMLGIIERPADRGGHSVYCSRVHIGSDGTIASVHRKLMPTYEERLSWAPGDGNGLQVHPVGPFHVGGLNCWENWMPLSRAALYAQGEDLHVALWPGNLRNTEGTTRFLAREGRSYVLSVSGLMRKTDVPQGSPARAMLERCPDVLANGGSCVAGPDGEWIVAPVTDIEDLIVATLDQRMVRRERQNFDQAGHYSRPDVTRLVVNRQRQTIASFSEQAG